MSVVKKRFAWIILLLAMVLAGGTYLIFSFRYPMVSAMRHFKIQKLEHDTLLVHLEACVKNDNFLGAKIKSAQLRLYIEGEFVGTGQLPQPVRLRGGDTTWVAFVAKFDIDAFAKVFQKMLDNTELRLRSEGTFTIGAPLRDITLQASSEAPLEAQKEIQNLIDANMRDGGLEVRSVKLRALGGGQALADVQVAFHNGLGVPFALQPMDLDLFLAQNTTSFAQWKLDSAQSLLPDSTAIINAAVTINNAVLTAQLPTLLLGKKVVRARGKAIIVLGGKTFEVPVEQETPLDMGNFF